MAGEGNDFFLNFGSDAAPFSRQIGEDLTPGIAKINELREALAAYEEQAGRSKSGSSPLGLSFGNLDAAADRIEKATAGFTKQFGDLVGQISGLAETLQSAMRSVRATATGGVPRVRDARLPPGARVGGSTPEGERVAVTGTRPVNRGVGDSDDYRQRIALLQQMDREKAAKGKNNTTAVSSADTDAAAVVKQRGKKTSDAVDSLTTANSKLSKTVTSITDHLTQFDTRLKTLLGDVGVAGKGKMARTATDDAARRANNVAAEVQIGNTSANPIPVIVVGGDAHPVGGHPHGSHPTTATTATSTGRAQEELAAVPEIVNAARGTRKAPREVLPDETVAPGEYFYPLGGNPKEPTRAYGIRPGETAGQYTARTEGVRSREAAARVGLPTLTSDEEQALNDFRASGGKIPRAKASAAGDERIGSYLPIDSVSAAPSGVPPEIQAIVGRRNQVFGQTSDAMHDFVLGELRRDPSLTQDGMSREAKTALGRVDRTILGNEGGSTIEDLGFHSEDLDSLRQGATRRRYLADNGFSGVQSGRDQQTVDELLRGGGRPDERIPYGLIGAGRLESNPGRVRVIPDVDEQAAEEETLGRSRRSRRGASTPVEPQAVTTAGEPSLSDLKEQIRAINLQIAQQKRAGGSVDDLQSAKDDLRAQRTALNQRAAGVVTSAIPEDTGSNDEPRRSRRSNTTSAEGRAASARSAAQLSPQELLSQGLITRGEVPLLEESRRVRAVRGTAVSPGAVSSSDTRQADANFEFTQRLTSEISEIESAIREINQELGRLKRTQSPRGSRGSLATGFQAGDDELAGARVGLEQEAGRLRAQLADLESGRTNAPVRGSGGGKPPTPPRPPAPPAASSEPEPESNERRIPVTDRSLTSDQSVRFAALQQGTQDALTRARDALLTPLSSVDNEASRSLQSQAIARAGAAFKADPAYRDVFNDAGDRARSFGGFIGLDTNQRGVRGYLRDTVLSQGGTADQSASATRLRNNAGSLVDGSAASSGADGQRVAQVDQIISASSGRVREARLAEYIAEERLQALRKDEAATAEQIARAEIQLSVASRNTAAAREAEARAEAQSSATQNRNAYQRVTGRSTGFGQDLLRHGTNALENTIGYSLVFTGFEKLREVVHTGIEADAAFVRLQASLDANGIAAGNLRSHLAEISANTATPIEEVTQAAAELAGQFKNIADLSFATNISAQLANISQGSLTAVQAADGLRDVIAAYGADWDAAGTSAQTAMQMTGDQIAHLSQLTGVSIKDITEGTTQIAQEAHDFGLNQRQAATLAAYVTQGTGESGEESAAQTSRMLSTLYNGQTQTALERIGIATPQEFQTGQIGKVLTDLISKYNGLNDANKQTIAGLMGTGIQARAFAALMNGGTAAVKELNGSMDDQGALAKQNQAYLNTVAGSIKQLDEDFQNLGSTLSRLGAFDAIGVLAKALDELFKDFNKYFGGIASLMDSNPLTAGLMHWSVLILEAAAAWKVFGGAATSALARTGILSIAPANAAARADAEAAGTAVPRAEYAAVSAGTAARGVGSSLSSLPGRAVRRLSLSEDETLQGRLGNSIGFNRGEDTPLLFPGVRSRFSGASAVGISRSDIRGALTERDTLGAATAESQTAVLPSVISTGNRDFDQLSHSAISTSSSVERMGLSSQSASVLIRTSSEEQAAAQLTLTESMRAFGAGLAASLSGLAVQLGILAVAITAITAIENSINDAKSRQTAEDDLLKGNVSSKSAAQTSNSTGFLDDYFGHSTSIVGSLGNAAQNTGKGAVNDLSYLFTAGQYSGPFGLGQSGPSNKSSNEELALSTKVFNEANKTLPTLGTADAVTAYEKTITDAIEADRDKIQKAGGNDKNSQAQIAYNINQLKATLNAQGQARINAINGLADIDKLNEQQAELLSTTLGTVGGLNANTLATQKGAVEALLDQTGLPTGSQAYKDLAAAGGDPSLNTVAGTAGVNAQGQIGSYDGNGQFTQNSALSTSTGRDQIGGGQNLPNIAAAPDQQQRLKALQAGYQQAISNEQGIIQSAAAPGGAGIQSDTYTQAVQALQTDLTAYQQASTSLYQNPTQESQNQASFFTQLGTKGGDQESVNNLKTANSDLQKYNATLDKDDPQYWQNLLQIEQNKAQIAELQLNPAIGQLTTQAAGTADSVRKAQLQYQQAMLTLLRDSSSPTSTATRQGDQAALASAALTTEQAEQALKEAQAQVGIASIRNSQGKAQAQLNDALRQEAMYRALGDRSGVANEQQQEVQARQALADAVEAQAEAEIDVTTAIQKIQGNDVGAAQSTLLKAQKAYSYAVSQYGKSSEQAATALVTVIQDQGAVQDAMLASVNGMLDLEIAELTARGQTGDLAKAAQDKVAEAENALQSYLRKGGKQSGATYDQLLGTIATAQRTAFDQQLQDQLDTLDFQQQTYQITSSQEVQALQQILKNKQLTLAEQRQITLQIKNLQDSIRTELTQGGLNIPSGIVLPTAYDVRRSLGAGFSGASAVTSNIVNNNQKIQINNNVPNSAVAAQIANTVIQLVNDQTKMGLRASSSTPRTVTTK